MGEIKALIERVEAATGPDRELDASVATPDEQDPNPEGEGRS